MFVGHYSASIFAKAIRPNIPFWVLILAAQLVDILWAFFISLGVEKVSIDLNLSSNPLNLYYMPFTHSLAAIIFWSIFAFLATKYISNNRLTPKDLLAISLVVASHWFLDLIVHRPDLHLVNEIKVGLGLWEYPAISFFTEIALLISTTYYLCSKNHFSKLNKLHIKIFCVTLIITQLLSVFVIIPENVFMLSVTALTTFIGFSVLVCYIENKYT